VIAQRLRSDALSQQFRSDRSTMQIDRKSIAQLLRIDDYVDTSKRWRGNCIAIAQRYRIDYTVIRR
jgi:hypothetical protein